eukprot:10861978-Alexandrium_andersonii.AAC.1
MALHSFGICRKATHAHTGSRRCQAASSCCGPVLGDVGRLPAVPGSLELRRVCVWHLWGGRECR